MLYEPDKRYLSELSCVRQIQSAVFNNQGWFTLPDDWFALGVEGVEGAAIFEPFGPGVVRGHYLFIQNAAPAAREIIAFLFDNTKVRVIEGVTPRDNRAARHLSRYLGFSPIGETTDCFDRPSVVYRMTKDECQAL